MSPFEFDGPRRQGPTPERHGLPCPGPRLRLPWFLIPLGLALVLGVSSQPMAAQSPGTVVGTITDTAGQPLSGVQIVAVGTQRGSISGADGRYTIAGVPAGERQIRATSLGYRAETRRVELAAGETVTVDFQLTTSAVALDEIVVTGTAGGVERRAIGNVVTNIRASDVMELAPVRDMQSLLNARAPGVLITPGTGMVGSGSQIRIRGSSSISLSNTPLLYVDGVRVDNAQNSGPINQAFGSSVISRINDFNPDDIESIEIIKGPAAATLYGTEAANGVIQIITKRGAQGAPQWNLTTRQGANWFSDAIGRVPVNYWRNPNTGQVESINFAQTEKDRGNPLWRTGHVQTYNLSVSGGTADFRYHISGNWDEEQGADWDNSVSRRGARANLTVVASPSMEITGNVGYTRGDFQLACEGGCGGTTWATYFSTPAHAQGDDRRRGARSFVPEYYWEVTDRTQELGRFTGSIQVNHTPRTWFAQRLTAGLDDTREDDQILTEISALYREWSPTGRGGKDVTRRDITNYTLDYSGTLTFPLTESFTSQTSFGTQYYDRMLRVVSASGQEFALPGLRVVNATAETSAGETFIQSTSLGVFLQQQFSWNDRRYVTVGLRADDHSAFGENFDLVYYPKISGAWVLSEEDFWNVGWVGDFRLRTAFGRAGEQPGAFDALRTFSAVPGPGDAATVTPGGVGNPELGPERAQEFEIGFEAGLLDDRAGVDFTFYRQRTRDAILLQPVAPSTGFPGSRFFNVGEVRNFGFELALRAEPVVRDNFRMETTLSLSRNDSEVVDLGEVDEIGLGFGITHKVGYPMASWFNQRIVSAEFDQNGRHIRSSMLCDDGAGGTTPCFNAAGQVAAPAVHLGRSAPLYEGALASTFTLFDRVRLYGLVDFKTGFKKWDHVTRVRCSLFNICEESVDPLQFIADRPAEIAAFQNGDIFGAHYTNNSSFLRFREVSASFMVPTDYAQRIGASRATVTLSARNLGTITNWTGMDPEARFLGGGRGGFGGFEQNHLPQLTSFVTSINLTF
ncbi:MAG: SusC/RagA family TonB-linked outer membrane protein [Gemmatimonadales bacterium]|nr:MAG: SusC/RagA family TonB-linked outer membrane protein [Gemmatimonadales bacterium]